MNRINFPQFSIPNNLFPKHKTAHFWLIPLTIRPSFPHREDEINPRRIIPGRKMPAGQNFNPPPTPVNSHQKFRSYSLTPASHSHLAENSGNSIKKRRTAIQDEAEEEGSYSLLHKNSRNFYPSPDLSPCQLPLCTFPHLQKSILTYYCIGRTLWRSFQKVLLYTVWKFAV